MREILQEMMACFFPRTCVGCGEALAGASGETEWEYLCAECAREVKAIGAEACVRCGVPVYGVVSGKRMCSVCRESPPKWDEARSLLRYKGPVRRWVKDYKYADARWVEREWEKLLTAGQFRWVGEFLAGTVVVPVPLHPLRQWWRGFNQAEALAKALVRFGQQERREARVESRRDRTAQSQLPLEKQTGERENQNLAEVRTDILRRVRWTAQQAKLPREMRNKNVKNAFDINTKARLDVLKSRRVVVVDDLLTTGATLSACVQALKRAGFKRVDVLTFARA